MDKCKLGTEVLIVLDKNPVFKRLTCNILQTLLVDEVLNTVQRDKNREAFIVQFCPKLYQLVHEA
jgi:hypothetical protein